MINAETITRFIYDISLGLISNLIVFGVALNWSTIKSFFGRGKQKFVALFGRKSLKNNNLTVVLDTYRDIRIAPQEIRHGIGYPQLPPQRFYKIFPDGHFTAFPGANEDIMGYCSARASTYIVEAFSKYLGIKVKSDLEASSFWDGSFVCFGSSISNIKSDDIKKNINNPLLANDMDGFITLKNGRKFGIDDGRDKGYVMKIRNPFFDGYSLFVCAGMGEWGTSGAAYYLATKWKNLSRRFGSNNFIVVVSVLPGADQSATEIYNWSNEKWTDRIRRFFMSTKN